MKSKKEALAAITENERLINGKLTTMFDCCIGTNSLGQKVRFSSVSHAALEERIEAFFRRQRSMGDTANLLKPSQAIDAAAALRMLEGAGVKRSLSYVVEQFLAATKGSREARDTTLGQAYAKYLDSFDPRQTAHLNCVRTRVGKFVSFFGDNRLLSRIGRDEVERFLAPVRKQAQKTFNNNLSYLKSFFAWCMKPAQNFMTANPAQDIAAEKIAYEEPKYLSVEDTEKIFREAERRGDAAALAYGTLAYFCGVRFAEMGRVAKDARAFVLEDETIRVAHPKGYLRGTRPRVFQVVPNALAWLKACDAPRALAKVAPQQAKRRFMDAAKAVGVVVPKNAGRHSFISYHVAAYGDPVKTEALAGTSAAMRVQNYMGLATKVQGERYFAIMPHGAS